MKKTTIVLSLLLTATIVFAQQEDQLITEDYVRQVITTLASDDMMGRAAVSPKQTVKAADFIASQFKETGLETFAGLSGYKQEFVAKEFAGTSMNNVVGVLKGKSKPDEIVIFSAHYDHIGIVPAVEGDSIANGADDDASGTTAVIALAKYFKKINNNARTLVFVAFTAEEVGGMGSRYFTEQVDASKVIAMFNIEMIGKPSKWGQNSAFITGFERSDFGSILQKNVKGTQFQFMPDPYPEQELFYRSDNARLAIKGVPAHSISTDQIDVDPYYHTVNDEVETLDMNNIVAAIKAIALGSKSIVSGEDTPTRVAPMKKKGK
ncbi:MAG TPA: M20/M25/M40 family metallo-hydrolase [Cyclobacteriaceae bacterium]|nr:M20/M25/M40 family metallo-hydrolase [Cyclobacteriaceae bacterium]